MAGAVALCVQLIGALAVSPSRAQGAPLGGAGWSARVRRSGGGGMILHPGGRYQRALAPGPLHSFHGGRWEAAGNWLRCVPTDCEPKLHPVLAQAPQPSEPRVVQGFGGRVIEASVG